MAARDESPAEPNVFTWFVGLFAGAQPFGGAQSPTDSAQKPTDSATSRPSNTEQHTNPPIDVAFVKTKESNVQPNEFLDWVAKVFNGGQSRAESNMWRADSIAITTDKDEQAGAERDSQQQHTAQVPVRLHFPDETARSRSSLSITQSPQPPQPPQESQPVQPPQPPQAPQPPRRQEHAGIISDASQPGLKQSDVCDEDSSDYHEASSVGAAAGPSKLGASDIAVDSAVPIIMDSALPLMVPGQSSSLDVYSEQYARLASAEAAFMAMEAEGHSDGDDNSDVQALQELNSCKGLLVSPGRSGRLGLWTAVLRSPSMDVDVSPDVSPWLVDAGPSSSQLVDAGPSSSQLVDAGLSSCQLVDADPSSSQLVDAGSPSPVRLSVNKSKSLHFAPDLNRSSVLGFINRLSLTGGRPRAENVHRPSVQRHKLTVTSSGSSGESVGRSAARRRSSAFGLGLSGRSGRSERTFAETKPEEVLRTIAEMREHRSAAEAEAKRLLSCGQVIDELLQTEANYLRDIKHVCDEFMEPCNACHVDDPCSPAPFWWRGLLPAGLTHFASCISPQLQRCDSRDRSGQPD